jgi:hypothetical protein
MQIAEMQLEDCSVEWIQYNEEVNIPRWREGCKLRCGPNIQEF